MPRSGPFVIEPSPPRSRLHPHGMWRDGQGAPPPGSGILDAMRRLLLAAAFALLACKSSAPHTVGAAAINTGLALGGAAVERASGRCYAVCTNGTVCNPNTGLCERPSADVYCEEAPGGGMRCVPLQIGKEREQRPSTTLPLGPSPATGTVQPPPAEASPRPQ
jgi:hypothetical protein